jgi:L-rhamnose mutarotase
MLSGILRNETAVQVSIGIMNAFVEMRTFLNANRDVFAKILQIDNQLLEHGRKFDEVFNLLQQPNIVKQSVFYKGQFYDAYQLIRDIIKQAKMHITIIDNYIDDTLLDVLAYKGTNITVDVITSSPHKMPAQALAKFKEQYGEMNLIESKDFHDRFIILDGKDVYALGASIKDLGKKCFELSKNEDTQRFCTYVQQVVEQSETIT